MKTYSIKTHDDGSTVEIDVFQSDSDRTWWWTDEGNDNVGDWNGPFVCRAEALMDLVTLLRGYRDEDDGVTEAWFYGRGEGYTPAERVKLITDFM